MGAKARTHNAGLSGTRYAAKDKQRWVDWYVKDEMTVTDICLKSGAGRHTIMHALKQAKVELRGNPRSFDRKAIHRDILAGKLSQVQIAKKHGCSARLVSDVARGKVGL